jgi:hypothetical protein
MPPKRAVTNIPTAVVVAVLTSLLNACVSQLLAFHATLAGFALSAAQSIEKDIFAFS